MQFHIVSPFFSIDEKLRTLLTSIPNLQLVVGDEFSTNDPQILKELSERPSISVKCIYRVDFNKRLHAKVFYGVDRNGRCRALIGSANFTVSGLLKNEEQAVSLDSCTATDISTLNSIKCWIDELHHTATGINWAQAVRTFENSPQSRRSTEDFGSYLKDQAQNYWVLKTIAGIGGKCQWQEFVNERVISVGWTDLIGMINTETGSLPNRYNRTDLGNAAKLWARTMANAGSQEHAVKTLLWFCREFARGDRVIVCNGYVPKQATGVRLFGLAIVDGEVYDDTKSNWWRLKRAAVLKRLEIDLPKNVFSSTLKKGSLRHTIHRISHEQYEAFQSAIEWH